MCFEDAVDVSSWRGWADGYRNSMMDTVVPEDIKAGGALPPVVLEGLGNPEAARHDVTLDKSGKDSLVENAQERLPNALLLVPHGPPVRGQACRNPHRSQ